MTLMIMEFPAVISEKRSLFPHASERTNSTRKKRHLYELSKLAGTVENIRTHSPIPRGGIRASGFVQALQAYTFSREKQGHIRTFFRMRFKGF